MYDRMRLVEIGATRVLVERLAQANRQLAQR